MSASKETMSSVNEAAPLSASNETESSLDKKVVLAKKFDKEMKDYAKATVKEFLGIYGYEEDVDINIEDTSDGATSQSESSCSNNKPQKESNLKRPANQSHCEAISSPDYGNQHINAESDEKNQSSVITHQTSGPIRYTVVSVCSPDCSTVAKSSEVLGLQLSTLERSSECFGQSSSTLKEPSECFGQSSSTLQEPSESLGDALVTEDGATLYNKEQLENKSFVCEHSTTNGISEVISGNISSLSQKEKSRLRMRSKRLNETPEKRTQRLQGQRDRARFRRANEVEGDREFRLVKDRTRQRLKRTNESEDIRETRLLRQRQSAQQRRALESPEQRQARMLKDRDRSRKRRETERAGVVGEWWSDDTN